MSADLFRGLPAQLADTILQVPDVGHLPSIAVGGDIRYVQSVGILYYFNGSIWTTVSIPGAVIGPGSSTNHAIARFDGTSGASLSNSLVTINDSGTITSVLPGGVEDLRIMTDTDPGPNPRLAITSDGIIEFSDGASGPINSLSFQGNTLMAQCDSFTAKGPNGLVVWGGAADGSVPLLRLRSQTGAGVEVSFSILDDNNGGSTYNMILPGNQIAGFFYNDGNGNISWSNPTPPTSGFVDTWLTADGLTKVVTHNLGTQNVIIQLYDSITFETISVDSEVRTDANTVTLTANTAPATSWTILIKAV
jgi:hypothetical protein